MQNSILDSALSYLKLGWSVIPLKPNSKEPLIKWAEFQKRRAPEAEVRTWFAQNPDMNVGIVTGAISDLSIVDLDGPEGYQSGESLGLESGVVSLTGNGRQLWFKNDVTLKNSVKLFPGVDVRADGGFVVAPPSVHPNGRTYRWFNPISALSVNSLQPFPMRLIVKDAVSSTSDVKSNYSANPKGWIAEALEGMTNGNIDNTLFKVCSRLRNDGYTENDALLLLHPLAERAGATPGHLNQKIRNVWERYEPKPVRATRMPGVSASPLILHSPSNPDSIDEFRKRTLASDGRDGSCDTGYTAFDTLTKGLKKGEVLTVAARTGVGKTNWVITPIRQFCENDKKVLLFSTEMSFDQIWSRYTATLGRSAEQFRQHQFFICDEFTPDIERIEEAIKNVNPDLFIFDHISHIGTDYHIISKFMSEIKRLARLYNIPAIVTAQLNRNADYVDQGNRVEPRLSMIQGSDQIGQMSAQVLLLNEKRIVDGTAEIEGIVVKNRHGDKGMINFGLKSKPHYEMVEL